MRLRNIKGSHEYVVSSNYVINNPFDYIGKWNTIFGNDNPINIEIGMGRGDFIIENAKRYSNVNSVGIEMYDSVVYKALKKLEEEDATLHNLKIIRMDAVDITKVFDHEINIIYLNFSDPWPKARHEDRRLSSKRFLERYDSLFKNEKIIIMKTDNVDLFNFSIDSLSSYGYNLKNVSRDLYGEQNEILENNIPTEYEKKFSSKGVKINRLEAYK